MENEAAIRLTVFLGGFALLAIWERSTPRRGRVVGWSRRWLTNWGVAVLNTAVVRLMAMSATALALPVLAVGAALDAQAQGWGLFNAVAWPAWFDPTVTQPPESRSIRRSVQSCGFWTSEMRVLSSI